MKFNLFKKFWFNRELKKVKLKSLNEINYKVIIFDSPIWISNIHRFSQVFDKDKVRFWFWNSVSNKEIITKIQSQVSSVSSFDSDNCENFNMNFLPQFNLNLSFNFKKDDLIYDVLFVGRVKNRLSEIENLYSQCKELGLNVFFHVKRDKFFQNSKLLPLKSIDINYNDYLKLINQSRAILEINVSTTTGLSLRAIESLFYDKKLITNNSKIKNYDFYNPQNILVIDNQNSLNLDFLNTNFTKVSDSIKKKYSFSEWLKNI